MSLHPTTKMFIDEHLEGLPPNKIDQERKFLEHVAQLFYDLTLTEAQRFLSRNFRTSIPSEEVKNVVAYVSFLRAINALVRVSRDKKWRPQKVVLDESLRRLLITSV